MIVIKHVEGHAFGLEDISGGKANAHWRFRTKDGKKHRSAKAAAKHLNEMALARLASRWRCRVEVVA
jgi:hypothetical protein